jgi:hypothetical protein
MQIQKSHYGLNKERTPMMNKKFLFISLLSIVQSNFCMDLVDVVPEPELVLGADGHEWTQIRRGNPAALVPFFDLVVAWKSDHIPEIGLKLEEHPNHCFGVVRSEFDLLVLDRVCPPDFVCLNEVPSLTVRLLTCAEARSWMRCPDKQPLAGEWMARMKLNKLRIENLMPSERLHYFRGQVLDESKKRQVCLLGLRKRVGNVIAQCPRDIVRLIAKQIPDGDAHIKLAQTNPWWTRLVFEDKK